MSDDIVAITLRLPADIHAQLVAKVEAKIFSSLNGAIVHYCARGIESDRKVEVRALRAVGVPEETIEAAIRVQGGES